MKIVLQIVGAFLVGVAVVIITSFLMGIPVSWLWNVFCPKVFGLPTIDWVDGAVLYILCNLLFASATNSNK
jgi:hypothetical protein